MAGIEVRPQAGRQEQFLSSPADIVIYGGAAGGGKTWGLLLEPLRHVGNGGFGAVIFRRSNPQIVAEGGLWDQSQAIYPLLGATPYLSPPMHWKFPSGARVTLTHLQQEKTVLDWQGAQVPLICFDELTHFTEYQFFYMLSRNRSLCGVRPYVRATTNPDADSWVAKFLEWWIDQETGYAIDERAGVVRYLVREGDEVRWFDAPTERKGIQAKSVAFIPASIYDNRLLLDADPGYLANLMALPLVERERLLGGNWKIKPTAGKVFQRGWFSIAQAGPAGGRGCLFWDFAATEKQLAKPDPDYTAWVLIQEQAGIWWVVECGAFQGGPAEVERRFVNTSRQWVAEMARRGVRLLVRWEIEPGSAGKRESQRLTRLLAGIDARGAPSRGEKLARAKSLAAQSEAGNVRLVAGAWNEQWLAHMHSIPDGEHDDILDASTGAFNTLIGAPGEREIQQYEG